MIHVDNCAHVSMATSAVNMSVFFRLRLKISLTRGITDCEQRFT